MRVVLLLATGAAVGQILGLLVLWARFVWEDYREERDRQRLMAIIRNARRV